MTLSASLFTKPGCHLCEQAEADLSRLRKALPHTLDLVDITASGELLRSYGERIPVLLVGGREYEAPLPLAVLERALRDAQQELTR